MQYASKGNGAGCMRYHDYVMPALLHVDMHARDALQCGRAWRHSPCGHHGVHVPSLMGGEPAYSQNTEAEPQDGSTCWCQLRVACVCE